MKRIWVLVSYLLRDLFRSLTGLLVIVAAFVFYLVGILGVTGGIDRDYFALVIGGFFGIFCLILSLVVADRAYRAESYLLLYRLSSRSTFLVSIVVAAVFASFILQIVVALLSLPRVVNPLKIGSVLDILPVWIGWLALGGAIGVHMSELVRRGWSRTVVYGLLAFVLFSLNQRQSGVPVGLSDRFSWIPSLTSDPVRWEGLNRLVDVIIWPISAAVRVARSTSYTVLEGLSPAVLLLVAALIFFLAVLLFDRKDLILPEN